MTNTKTGLVVVASQYESGGQRAQELAALAKASLEQREITVAEGAKVVWDAADAIDVCKELRKQEIDSLTIILSTWVTDSLLYVLVHELPVPVVFWAVPYTETFSIGCIQHFGSALTTHGIPYEYVYGLTDDAKAADKAAKIAEAGRIIKAVKSMKLALVGPRQTWRVAGPQDTTNEEWEFSQKFGPTLVHIEMEEIMELAEGISDKEAKKVYGCLKKRTGRVLADEETMLHMTKVYMAVKETVKRYSLDALAAECYPFYSGQMNLPSSWLADEGIIVDTEGDVGHTMVMYMLNLAAKGGATALGEVGSMDDENRILALAHEGSTAHSLAEDVSKVQISPSGEKGCFVGLPLREAKSRIWEAGLNVAGVTLAEDIDRMNLRQARVYLQQPDQGHRVVLGTGISIALSLDSLTVASGVSRSDRYGNRVAAREQALRDSLAAEGYSGDELQEEMDWIIRIENGEATPAERRREEEDAIVRSLEEYGGTVRHDDESEFFE